MSMDSCYLLFSCGLLLTLVLLISILSGRSRSSRRKNARLPPGVFGWPLFGETLDFVSLQRKDRICDFFRERTLKYGPVFKTHLIGSPTIVLPNPAGNKLLFFNEDKLVANAWPKITRQLLGDTSMAVVSRAEHRRLRQLFMAFLKPEALQRYIPKTSLVSKAHLAEKWFGKDPVYIYPAVKAYTFSLVCNLFFSLEDEREQEELGRQFHEFVRGLFSLPLKFPGTRCYKAFKARETILKLLDRLIAKRKREGIKEDDLLSVFLTTKDEDGKLMSEKEIKDNVILLLFAGHDTSSTNLTMLIKLLAENPYWKHKLLEEHMEIKMQKANQDGYVLDWDDLKKMKWTWRAGQESLRLYPPVGGSYREALRDFEFGGYEIPKGWQLYWSQHTTRLEPEYFPEPEKFDPSRFEGSGPEPYVFTPFGGGTRMCPGFEYARMEILVFVHYLITNYDWKLQNESEKVTVDPLPVPVHNLPAKLIKRTLQS